GRVARPAATQGEGLEERADGGGAFERARALEGVAQGARDNAVGLAVRPGEAEGATIVMARVHHGQVDVGDGGEVLPHLADTEVSRCRGGEAENVEGDGHAERLEAVAQQADMRAHGVALRLAGPAGGKDGGGQPVARLV